MLTARVPSVFAHHIYALLFCWVFCEQVGLPLPSAPLLVAAGALCLASPQRWSYTVAVVITACVLADFLWFQLGRSYGRRLLEFVVRISLMSPASLVKANDKLTKYNGFALLFAKFIPGISTVAPPLSGHSGMTRSRVLLWDVPGSMLWALTWLLGGRLLLHAAESLGRSVRMEPSAWFIGALSVVVAFAIWKLASYVAFLLELRRLRVTPMVLQQMLSRPQESADLPPYVVDLRVSQDILVDPRAIPSAIRVEPQSFRRNNQLIPRDREVVLYCSCPSEATSTLWAFRLRRLGVKRVRLLWGGMDGWREAGYALQAPATAAG